MGMRAGKAFIFSRNSLPTTGRVLEAKLGGDGPLLVDDTDVVMIVRPIEGGEVRYFCPCSVQDACGTNPA